MNREPILCPTCGDASMVHLTRDVEGRSRAGVFVAHGVELDECPACGERLYDLAALRQIRLARDQASATAPAS